MSGRSSKQQTETEAQNDGINKVVKQELETGVKEKINRNEIKEKKIENLNKRRKKKQNKIKSEKEIETVQENGDTGAGAGVKMRRNAASSNRDSKSIKAIDSLLEFNVA